MCVVFPFAPLPLLIFDIQTRRTSESSPASTAASASQGFVFLRRLESYSLTKVATLSHRLWRLTL